MNLNTASLPSIWGSLIFDTTLSLEELGSIISEVMFSNLPFQGRDQNIYNEVPAIFIKDHPLGLKVVLSGDSQTGYRLEVQSYFKSKDIPNERVYFDGY